MKIIFRQSYWPTWFPLLLVAIIALLVVFSPALDLPKGFSK